MITAVKVDLDLVHEWLMWDRDPYRCAWDAGRGCGDGGLDVGVLGISYVVSYNRRCLKGCRISFLGPKINKAFRY